MRNAKLYLKYFLLNSAYTIILIYFFFINTHYEKENLLPFSLFLLIFLIRSYFLFKYDTKMKFKLDINKKEDSNSKKLEK